MTFDDVVDGEIVEGEVPTIGFQELVSKALANIAFLEGEYRNKEAQELQNWLGNFVATWWDK